MTTHRTCDNIRMRTVSSHYRAKGGLAMSKVKFDFVDGHKGEYWYNCTECGASDWFAHYDRPQDPSQCLPTCKKPSNLNAHVVAK